MFVIRSPFGVHAICTSRETADKHIARLSRRYSGVYITAQAAKLYYGENY